MAHAHARTKMNTSFNGHLFALARLLHSDQNYWGEKCLMHFQWITLYQTLYTFRIKQAADFLLPLILQFIMYWTTLHFQTLIKMKSNGEKFSKLMHKISVIHKFVMYNLLYLKKCGGSSPPWVLYMWIYQSLISENECSYCLSTYVSKSCPRIRMFIQPI